MSWITDRLSQSFQQAESICKNTIAQFDTNLYRNKNGNQHSSIISNKIHDNHALTVTNDFYNNFILPRKEYVKNLIKSGLDLSEIRSNINNNPDVSSMDDPTIECIRDSMHRDSIASCYNSSNPQDVEQIYVLHQKMSSGDKFSNTEINYLHRMSGGGSLQNIVDKMKECIKESSPSSEHATIDSNDSLYMSSISSGYYTDHKPSSATSSSTTDNKTSNHNTKSSINHDQVKTHTHKHSANHDTKSHSSHSSYEDYEDLEAKISKIIEEVTHGTDHSESHDIDTDAYKVHFAGDNQVPSDQELQKMLYDSGITH